MTSHAPLLDPASAPDDPLTLFETWFSAAQDAEVPLPHWMALATSTPDGAPSVRAVLLKGHGRDGLVFYTNRRSRKGRELAVNAHAAVCFVWTQLDRQVRVEGPVELVDDATSDEYWESRPLRARAGAAASPQSRIIAARDELVAEVEQLEEDHPDGVPRPDHWGGYRIVPVRWEFWQGRDDRLHDRLRYESTGNGWVRERLAP